MKKTKVKDEMRPEYQREDLGKGVRGKYASAYAKAHNIVLLDPEVAKAFPSEEAVNKALLSLMKEAQTSEELTKNSNKRQ
ncbi:MAG TPA: hypothetical protein DEO56_11310 [Nitrosomonas nitrosa]|uniref:Uncharacterized protein n=1 Tax=Nitrosomonas nitrosa TaxID=52442 RepID=A0A8E0RC67_9PROT|nr:hypothetical protein [Nitrosomonas nitrosa]CAE6511501.1 conserved hypothetical protein [Nitrosomonas nitrosa]HBZ31158.1 hypothetical protein [Nitrosomonas nitrosa]HNP52304.1 hypothetical protein [Nitrosomonas nitrosa]